MGLHRTHKGRKRKAWQAPEPLKNFSPISCFFVLTNDVTILHTSVSQRTALRKKYIKSQKRMDYLHRDVIFLTYTVQCFTSQIPWLVKIKVLNQLCSPQYTLYQIKTSGRPWTNGLRAPAFIRTWVGAPAIILCYLSKSLQFTFFISENGPLWRWNNILPRLGHVGRTGLDARVTMLMGTGMATISL